MIKEREFASVEHLLPESARDLIAIIGVGCTFKLVKDFGGTTFPINTTCHQDNKWAEIRYALLEEVIGVTAADILMRHYNGSVLYIPRCLEAMTEFRDRSIRKDFDLSSKMGAANETVFELALKYRVSDRTIWNILKNTDRILDKPEQNTLF